MLKEVGLMDHASAKVEDPVCHMSVQVGEDTPRSTYNGHEYFFCAKGCKVSFDKDPAKYVS